LTSVTVGDIFRATTSGPIAARVTMTIMAIRALVFSVVRCPECGRRIMDVPGEPLVYVRTVAKDQASGMGRIVSCKRCSSLVEVIEREGGGKDGR